VSPSDLRTRAVELVDLVLQTLDIEATGTAPFLFMTSGLPGTGKTTFSRGLASRTGAAHLESDRIRSLIYKQPRFSAGESMFLFATIHAAAEVLLSRGHPVIVDATSLTESERRPLYSLARDASAPLLIAVFDAPEPVVVERLKRREAGQAPGDYSQAGLAVYHQMRDRFRPVSRPHWLVDSTDPAATARTLAEIADLAQRR
jgi:predicted kinase